jgi:hypothetical protein
VWAVRRLAGGAGAAELLGTALAAETEPIVVAEYSA